MGGLGSEEAGWGWLSGVGTTSFNAFLDFVEDALIADAAHEEGRFFAVAGDAAGLFDGGGAGDAVGWRTVVGGDIDGGDDDGGIVVHVIAPDEIGGAAAHFLEGHGGGSGGGVTETLFDEDFDDGVSEES